MTQTKFVLINLVGKLKDKRDAVLTQKSNRPFFNGSNSRSFCFCVWNGASGRI